MTKNRVEAVTMAAWGLLTALLDTPTEPAGQSPLVAVCLTQAKSHVRRAVELLTEAAEVLQRQAEHEQGRTLAEQRLEAEVLLRAEMAERVKRVMGE